MRILIADDDSVSRRLLERTLVALGHEVTAVAAGDAGLLVAERVRRQVADAPVQAGDDLVPMTVSLGLAFSRRADVEPEALIQAADEALYRAKAAGRNRVAQPVSVEALAATSHSFARSSRPGKVKP